MSKKMFNAIILVIFKKTHLMKLKTNAQFCVFWFRKLRLDCVLVDLIIIVTESIRSICLIERLFAIITKIEDVMKNQVSKAVYSFGFNLDNRISELVQK